MDSHQISDRLKSCTRLMDLIITFTPPPRGLDPKPLLYLVGLMGPTSSAMFHLLNHFLWFRISMVGDPISIHYAFEALCRSEATWWYGVSLSFWPCYFESRPEYWGEKSVKMYFILCDLSFLMLTQMHHNGLHYNLLKLFEPLVIFCTSKL